MTNLSETLFTIHDKKNSTSCTCDILDKEKGALEYVAYMLDRTSSMFEYSGLPDTIPEWILEYYLQAYGIATVAEVNGSLYVFNGRPGGAPDPYYRPTTCIVANPALNISLSFKIVNHFAPHDTQVWSTLPSCVLMYNDTHRNGLLPMYSRYATQLTENDISIRSAQINSRQQALISGSTDSELISAKEYLNNLEAGKLATVASAPFLSGINVQEVKSDSNAIIQLIELQQYLKAAWFNDIGLNANFNMKREYLSSEEIATNNDVLLPLADDMLKRREIGLEYINSTFGTNITVKKNSAWEKKQRESDASIATSENESQLSSDGNAESEAPSDAE